MTKWLEILIESVNYILISYALFCMSMLFKEHWFFILFSASGFWIVSKFFTALNQLTNSKLASGIIWLCNLVAVCILICFFDFIPF